VDYQVRYVNDNYAHGGRKSCPYRSKYKRFKLKEHIVRVYPGEINYICSNRYYKTRNGRQKKLPPLIYAFIGMVTGKEHSKSAKHDNSVVKEGVESCKGYTGITTQNSSRVYKIYTST
jgi:hypothetical protein